MIYVFVVICLMCGSLAQGRTRTCSDVNRMENFDKYKFSGRWYVVKKKERYDVTFCTSMDLFSEDDVDYIYVKYRIPSQDGESILMTSTDDLPIDSVDNVILTTDYDSYAILYSCVLRGLTSLQIITRSPHPSEEVLTTAVKIIEEKFGYIKLHDVRQWLC